MKGEKGLLCWEQRGKVTDTEGEGGIDTTKDI